jgi:iron complex outermembrane recepter protein
MGALVMTRGKTVKSWAMMTAACIALGAPVFGIVMSVSSAKADAPAAAAQVRYFRIAQQDLVAALNEFGRQSGRDILFSTDVAGQKRSAGVNGPMTAEQALHTLLAGTGLTFRATKERTFLIEDVAATPPAPPPQQGRSADVGEEANVTPSDADTRQDVERVTVTGTRIRTGNASQDVKVFDREKIDRSGRTTVTEFLNTVPAVALSSTEQNTETSVSLRGLPVGTTLVLINGRRVGPKGVQGTQSQNDFFDLNNIPLGVVERIEVVAGGSSAVYGSDAIAGVVNILLRRNFDGVEGTANYGWADGVDETSASLAWGKEWERGGFSIVGSYQTRGELTNTERALTASNDYRAFGGANGNFPMCNPGNVFSIDGTPLPGAPAGSSATFAAVLPTSTGTPTFTDFSYGTLNECAFALGRHLSPATQRAGVFAQANYQITPSIEVFAELMYSHTEQDGHSNKQFMFGTPASQSFRVSASNPYNPFGRTVGIAATFDGVQVGTNFDAEFFRPLVGARGTFLEEWDWEVAAWQAADWTEFASKDSIANNVAIQNALNSSDPATALNPFVVGSFGSPSLVDSLFSDGLRTFTGRAQSVNGFARGPLLSLPAGDIQLVLGGEYDRGTLSSKVVSAVTIPLKPQTTYHRDSYAAFAEARVPIFGAPDTASSEILAVTLAGRYDHYSDFGSVTTPQVGAELRPFDELLLRATYAEAFKAPALEDLYSPVTTSSFLIRDPISGLQTIVPGDRGGNPNLRPLGGVSRTFGFVWSASEIPGLKLLATHWEIEEQDAIQNVTPQFVVDNEVRFPGRVTRNASGAIIHIDASKVNFGSIEVAGIDYEVNYSLPTDFGDWSGSLSASQTYEYTATLTAGAPPLEGVSRARESGNWAPRWKGIVGLGWTLDAYSANVGARYVGSYIDYRTPRDIGNFWTFDANLRYDIGDDIGADGAYVAVGAVNLFDTSPEYSSFSGNAVGYDPSQADIRGRFLYVRLGVKS